MTTALIAGAGGLIGGYLLNGLLESERYSSVRAIVRRRLDVDHPKLEQIIVDWDRLSELGDKLKADDIFCTLGTTMKQAGSKEAFRKVDFDYPVALAAYTRRLGARSYSIVTALGADPHSRLFYNRVKGEVEAAVRETNFQSTNIFRPSLLLGNRKEFRFAERLGGFASKAATPLMVGPLRKVRPVEAADVAKVMLSVASDERSGVYIIENDDIRRRAGKS